MYDEILEYQFRAIARAVRLMSPGELVVLDIDETCLSNVRYVLEKQSSEHDDVIPACLQLFEAMRHAGLKYAFVSGRREKLRRETIRDLHRAGFDAYEDVYLCPDEYSGDMWKYKSDARRDLHRRGYVIAATIGDQISDLMGEHTGLPFLLYNPYYRANARGVDVPFKPASKSQTKKSV